MGQFEIAVCRRSRNQPSHPSYPKCRHHAASRACSRASSFAVRSRIAMRRGALVFGWWGDWPRNKELKWTTTSDQIGDATLQPIRRTAVARVKFNVRGPSCISRTSGRIPVPASSSLVNLPDCAVAEHLAPTRPDSGNDDGGHPRLFALSAMSLIGGMTGEASAEARRKLLGQPNDGANPDKAKRLWRELFDGVRDCWLTIPTRASRGECGDACRTVPTCAATHAPPGTLEQLPWRCSDRHRSRLEECTLVPTSGTGPSGHRRDQGPPVHRCAIRCSSPTSPG